MNYFYWYNAVFLLSSFDNQICAISQKSSIVIDHFTNLKYHKCIAETY